MNLEKAVKIATELMSRYAAMMLDDAMAELEKILKENMVVGINDRPTASFSHDRP